MCGVVVGLALATACWTSSPPSRPSPSEVVANPAQPAPARRFEITLQRTPCFGRCPVYPVTLSGDGRVRWRGEANVEAIGERRGYVRAGGLEQLAQALDRAEFLARDEHGQLPQPKMKCVRTGTRTTCTMSTQIAICSSSTSAVITVRRGRTRHRVHHDHCAASPLDELEALIDEVAGTAAWIGRSSR
jgi:hypothetical protein